MDKSTLEKLDNQIQKLRDKLDNLETERDKVYAKKLYDLIGRYFENVYYDILEVFKVNGIHKYNGIYTIECTYLKYSTCDYKVHEYFVYYKSYDIPLYSNEEDSIYEFNKNYREITKEEFNSFVKESFNTYSKQFLNETI